MMMTLRRWIALLAVVVGATLIGFVAHLLLPPRQSAEVAVPSADASPEQVVAAYLAALNAHDCDTAAALVVENHDSARSWCTNVSGLTSIKVGEHAVERPEYSGHSASQEVVAVPVTFDLNWRAFHSDGSMPEGPTTWGYLLVRDSAHPSWRIFDQGVG
jgi:hypothetical protein